MSKHSILHENSPKIVNKSEGQVNIVCCDSKVSLFFNKNAAEAEWPSASLQMVKGSSDLRASWRGWGSRHDRPLDSPASCRTLSDPRRRSWSTRPHAPSSLVAWSSSSCPLSSSLLLVSPFPLEAGSERGMKRSIMIEERELRKCQCRLVLLVERPGSRYNWAPRTCRPSCRCPDTPGCNWKSAPLLKNIRFNPSVKIKMDWNGEKKLGKHQTFGDVLQSKQSHSRVSVHSPLLRFAVGLAAVVHEAGLVPFGPSIYDPVLKGTTHKSWCLLKEACQWGGGVAHTHLVQCEHVEVTDVMFLSVPDPGSTLFLVYNLPHIFTHKCSLW